MSRKWQVYEGSNGWYVAVPDAAGFHSQPASWATSAWFATRADAEEARAQRERDQAEWDASYQRDVEEEP